MDDELKDCIACNFEYEKIPVQRCEPNMSYNYLTGKCEKLVFSGFNPPPDCYNVCENIKTPTTVPEQIKKCGKLFLFIFKIKC